MLEQLGSCSAAVAVALRSGALAVPLFVVALLKCPVSAHEMQLSAGFSPLPVQIMTKC
jgi:hypothetical protein